MSITATNGIELPDVSHVGKEKQREVASIPKADVRIPALDGLRGVASMMVVAYHFGPRFAASGGRFAFWHSVPPLWFQGVDLFFVLSGFLISGILVNARESPRYFSTFYVRRVFRIFPLYYLVFFSYVLARAIFRSRTSALGALFENPLPLWLYLLYLQNFAMAAANNFGPLWMAASWSLAVEEQFYLTLPVIIRHIEDKGLFRLSLIGIVGAPVLRAIIQKFRFVPALSSYVLLPTHLDALATGVVVMLLLRHHSEPLIKNRRRIALVTAALWLAWTVYPYVPNPQAIRLAFITTTMNSLIFGSVLLSLLVAPTSALARFLSTRMMRNLGYLAYSTYLLHPILLFVAFRIIRGGDPNMATNADMVAIAAALLATFSLAWLSWSQFESRLLRMGHRAHY